MSSKKILKAAGIFAACALWLCGAVVFMPQSSHILHGTYLDWVKGLFSGTSGANGINNYLTISGFIFWAFYLTVLLPKVLRPVWERNVRLKKGYRIAAGILLCLGAACSACGCLFWSRTPRVIEVINLDLTPVSLILIIVTCLIPLGIRSLRRRLREGKAAQPRPGQSVLFYVLLVVIALLHTVIAALLLAIVGAFSSGAVSPITGMCSNAAMSGKAFFQMVVLAPLIEEVAFRGLIQNHLRKAMPGALALVITAVFFGLWHRNIGQFVYTFAGAVLWGTVFNAAGKVRHTWVMHFIHNLSATMAFSVSGKAVLGRLTVLPALTRGLLGLSPVPAVLLLLVLCALVIVAVRAALRVRAGEKLGLRKGDAA